MPAVLKDADVTASVWPSRTFKHIPDSGFHILTVLSKLDETINVFETLKATDDTA